MCIIILNQHLLDDMGARIDELELSINDLKAEMGSDGMTPTKVKDEESKPADGSAWVEAEVAGRIESCSYVNISSHSSPTKDLWRAFREVP